MVTIDERLISGSWGLTVFTYQMLNAIKVSLRNNGPTSEEIAYVHGKYGLMNVPRILMGISLALLSTDGGELPWKCWFSQTKFKCLLSV